MVYGNTVSQPASEETDRPEVASTVPLLTSEKESRRPTISDLVTDASYLFDGPCEA